MSTDLKSTKPPSANEGIKSGSRFLRGTIAEDLADTSTGAISESNSQLTKFHGLYLQDDRDQRSALKKGGKEKAFGFMLRVRLPGGRATPQQWLVLDRLADELASPSLRLTTRQTFQFHGILKGNVKPLDPGYARGAARFDCGLRRRESQRDGSAQSRAQCDPSAGIRRREGLE